MKLQTHIPLSKETRHPIDYDSKTLLLGSCFSENIGNKLEYFKFQSTQNPFGILFHPKAIETFIENAINLKEYDENDVFYLNERYHCFDSHSKLSTASKEELLINLNAAVQQIHKRLTESTHIIITLGTAWAYRLIESDTIVANCHKVPQKKFLKELLSVDEIAESLEAIVSLVRSINPDVNFMFTVSPVRHLKDGFVQNQQSKAHLISAIHHVVEPRKRIFYFPSYEIMMDELRDYRFYAEDMIHPSKTAIDYIWSKFTESWVSESAFKTMKEVASIQKRMLHKPFNATSEEHQQFLEKLSNDVSALQKSNPNIIF
ncbi:GSCFA domain-containing protein [Pseudotenacibaculum sp. MALMAid0570]|uniref:GSCFA domain-containing protein n=1 Tax=Pseudotenacibaculum sp. MALMAid0570 TaxID=3143938 RepID=UPI0032DE9931